MAHPGESAELVSSSSKRHLAIRGVALIVVGLFLFVSIFAGNCDHSSSKLAGGEAKQPQNVVSSSSASSSSSLFPTSSLPLLLKQLLPRSFLSPPGPTAVSLRRGFALRLGGNQQAGSMSYRGGGGGGAGVGAGAGAGAGERGGGAGEEPEREGRPSHTRKMEGEGGEHASDYVPGRRRSLLRKRRGRRAPHGDLGKPGTPRNFARTRVEFLGQDIVAGHLKQVDLRSCPLDFGIYRANETRVHVFKDLASIAYWNGVNYYHTMVESMPSLLVMRALLANNPGLPIAYRSMQAPPLPSPPVPGASTSPIPGTSNPPHPQGPHPKVPQELFFDLFALVGLPPETLNTALINDNELFFAQRLILPAQAQCGRPGTALVRYMRRNFLLPGAGAGAGSTPGARRGESETESDSEGVADTPGGGGGEGKGGGGRSERAVREELPAGDELELARAGAEGVGAVRAPDAATRTARQLAAPEVTPAGTGGAAAGGEDWRVVINRRQGSRQLVGEEQLVQEVARLLPPGRLEIFDGTLELQDAKRLFGRTRLYIAPHGAALTNMVFMRANASVLEIRPREFDNGCYHYLAAICEVRYYLLRGEGSKETSLVIDIGVVVDLVKSIVHGW
eukprot:jgi/Mesen1/2819/ME000172S01974